MTKPPPRRPYRRTRSSKALAGSLYAPLIRAIAEGLYIVIAALGNSIAKVIRAIRRRRKGDDECQPPPPNS